jgi:hypothetical protein
MVLIAREVNIKLFLNAASAVILLTGAVTALACFFFFYFMHPKKRYEIHGVHQVPTFSLAGSYFPGDIIFTLGLHIMAFVFFTFFAAVYFVYEDKIGHLDGISSIKSDLHKWNKRLLFLALTFTVLMALVGSVSLETSPSVHGTIAFFMFFFALIHMLVFYFKMAKPTKISTRKYRMIQLALFVYVPFNIAALALCFLVVSLCSSHTCWSFAINMQPILEFTTIFAFMIYMLSFSQAYSVGDSLISDAGDGSLRVTTGDAIREDYADILFGDAQTGLLSPASYSSTSSMSSSSRLLLQ